MNKLDWYGLYNESWQGEITPEAFSHPAKFSRGLIRQIYQHMLDEGYIKAGDHIADPFGGVGLGALEAMRHGMHWHGKELEPRFVELGNQNIGLWNARYKGWFPVWGTAVLVQGDSRYFAQGMGMADGAISSPPYIDSVNKETNGIDTSMFSGRDKDRTFGAGNSNIETPMHYGRSSGQLGSMKEGNFAAAISSPPYGDAVQSGDGPGARWDADGHPGNPDKVSSANAYGTTPGNLGNMPYDAAVSSPPFEEIIGNAARVGRASEYTGHKLESYGVSVGNIGNDTGATFWTASRIIVEQIHAVLKPGGVAAFVCGDFVRKGQRVYFGQQWLDLCTAVGFEPLTWAVCWKQETGDTQLDIFGGKKTKRVDRVSFFRRLANEKNPDNAILNEDVIFVRRVS